MGKKYTVVVDPDASERLTILTDPVQKWHPEDAEKELADAEKERVTVLCDAWVESLQSYSISFKNAAWGLRDVISHCEETKVITGEFARSLERRFYPLLMKHIHSTGGENGVPSGLVNVVKLSNPVLRQKGFNHAWDHADGSLYPVVAKMFEKYGVKKKGKRITKDTIKSWMNKQTDT